MTEILIVGGGASAVLLAVHLLRENAGGCHVTIVERRPTLGAGIAYATNNPNHLLNVRASNMSAFPDDPDHFARWLRALGTSEATQVYDLDSFAPRHLYRDYLAGLLDPLIASGQLRHVQADVVAVHQTQAGMEVENADGSRLSGDILVIATGNEGPSLPEEPWRIEGWTDDSHLKLGADAPIVVIGTGLTMVDRVLTLLHRGHTGRITALSRRGLAPQAHRTGRPSRIDHDTVPFGQPVSRQTEWLRRLVQDARTRGVDWRSVIDGLRPHTQDLWQGLSIDDQRRFLRHARPYWDAHRHRIAPDAERRLNAARAAGQLRIIAARLVDFVPREHGVDVHVAHRRSSEHEMLHAAVVFECRGRAPDITRSENRVLRQMQQAGLARPDRLGLGLAVSRDCAVVSAAGQTSERLYAMGPVTSGTFWEIVAVPDIRQQAQQLANHLRTKLPA